MSLPLHLLRCGDTEQAETVGEHLPGSRTQLQPGDRQGPGLVVTGLIVSFALAYAPRNKGTLKLPTDDKSLTKDVAALTKASNNIAGLALTSLLFGACDAALTADALQGTWQTFDQVTAALQNGTVYFGAQTPVDDTFLVPETNACATLKITRTQALPPTVGNIAALLLLLHP